MASAMEGETAGERRGRLLDVLMGAGGGQERDPHMFVPIIMGMMGPRGGEGEEAPPADRIVRVNPLTEGMVVLRAGGGRDLAAVMHEILAADGGSWGPLPASKASIEAMRVVERPAGYTEKEEECAVCLDGLWAAEEETEAVVKEMPCQHMFHRGCIEKWLGMHGSCPVCRYRMPEEQQPGGKKAGVEEEADRGEEAAGRRSAVEREIWVTFGFSGRAAAGHPRREHD